MLLNVHFDPSCPHSQLPGRPELAHISPFQKPVALGDIPFYFSREEWGSLDPAQRDLFWDIKRENSQNAALGKQICWPLFCYISASSSRLFLSLLNSIL